MKKLTSILLTLLLMLNILSMTVISVSAVDATELPLDTVVNGGVAIGGEENYYKFTIEKPARVLIGVASEDQTTYDKKMTYTVYTDNMDAKIAQIKEHITQYMVHDLRLKLEAGTYYLALKSNKDFSFNINIKITEYYTNTEVEPNNLFYQAQPVESDEVVHGLISATDCIDFYKITLTKRQRITMYTLGTHVENYEREYKSVINGLLAFDLYRVHPDAAYSFYTEVDKKSCYYNYNMIVKNDDFDAKYDGFEVDGEKWEQTEDMVLNAGTYYFVFKFDSLGRTDYYKFMYKLDDPVPALYNKYHSDEFNLKYKSASAGKYIHLRVCDSEVAKWTSENTEIAKVNKNGKVTTLSKGTTNIIATLANGEELKCTLTVTSNPALKVNGKGVKSITLNKGEKVTVKIQGKATNVNNKYTDTKIAKISGKKNAAKFTVKGLKKGTTTLKIKVNGKKLSLKVNVK